jgi:hypothetical protein
MASSLPSKAPNSTVHEFSAVFQNRQTKKLMAPLHVFQDATRLSDEGLSKVRLCTRIARGASFQKREDLPACEFFSFSLLKPRARVRMASPLLLKKSSSVRHGIPALRSKKSG